MKIYDILFSRFGPQHWWPGDSPFEIIVGAVLTQNTNWANVEKAIRNLKTANLLSPNKINDLDTAVLAEYIRPAGYYNLKAKRLKNLIRWLCDQHNANLENLEHIKTETLRQQLLAINGIGRETADSILLYALNKLSFVVDTYTYRVLVRHRCIYPEADYEEIRDYCQSKAPQDIQLYNEFHALFVRVGKDFCKPTPKCALCPLNSLPHDVEPS